jgi:aspartokinase-like uncharacterized kinase
MGSPSLLRRAWIVKLSGSLAEWGPLIDWLKLFARHAPKRPIIIVPGGGPFAHAVRNVQDVWRLDNPIAHRMALLAMEQYGLLLKGVCPSLRLAADLADLQANAREGRVSVWLPTRMALDRLMPADDWDAGADSLAAWLAAELGVERLVLVKSSAACPCGATDAAAMAEEGIVDAAFPAWAAHFRGEIWCVSRERLEQMDAALAANAGPGCALRTRHQVVAAPAIGVSRSMTSGSIL